MTEISAATVQRLMRRHHKTIRGISTRWNIPMVRVRSVRRNGVKGAGFVRDWIEILTTD